MERKLASIQRVLNIEPIANADAIELTRINGWQCVVKKREFCVGDLGVFLEIDSIRPTSKPSVFCGRASPEKAKSRRKPSNAPATFVCEP